MSQPDDLSTPPAANPRGLTSTSTGPVPTLTRPMEQQALPGSPKCHAPPALAGLVSSSSPDAIADSLCLGDPWDVQLACQRFVESRAYLLDPECLAVRAIARLMMLAGKRQERIATGVRSLIETIAAPLLAADGEELERLCPGGSLRTVLARRLGVREAAISSVQVAAHSYPLLDRRVLYGCLVGGLTPKACARRCNESADVVGSMLAAITRYALDVDQALARETS